MTEYLSVADVARIIELTIGAPADTVITDAGLVLAAIQRPAARIRSTEIYGSLPLKAAALLESFARHAPLTDGNKRVAWLSVNVFLELNGHEMRFSDNEAYNLLVEVAHGYVPTLEIAERIAAHLRPLDDRMP